MYSFSIFWDKTEVLPTCTQKRNRTSTKKFLHDQRVSGMTTRTHLSVNTFFLLPLPFCFYIPLVYICESIRWIENSCNGKSFDFVCSSVSIYWRM